MSGEQQETPAGVETPSPVEAEAKQLGWAPKEKWRGDPEHWVDAETFVKRGKEMMPLLKAHNKQLEAQLAAQAAQLSEATTTIKQFETTLKDLTEFQQEVVKQQVEATVARLKAERRAARDEGDTDRADEISDELAEATLKAKALKEAPAKKDDAPPSGAQPNVDPAYAEWAKGREWLKDPVKSTTAVGVAQKLRMEGNKLTGVDFYDAVEAEVERIFGDAPVRKPGKMEAGSGGGGGVGGGPKTPSYDSLPPEAKAICDKQAAKFVGEKGKAFKTLAEWRTHYAKLYLEQ